MMRAGPGQRYVRSVRWTWRAAGANPGAVADAGFAIAGIGVTAVAAWGPQAQIGTLVVGPLWLRAVLPLLIGAPLFWRRRAPLLMWTALWAAITLQAVVTPHAAAGLQVMFVLFVGSYSLAAHSSLRRAVSGLAIMAPGAVIWGLTSRGIGNGLLVIPPGGLAGQPRNAGAFLVGEGLAWWLLGVFVRARREAAALAGRNAALEQQAERARPAERARMSRELPDIGAHHLTAVGLQAAGAQASGR